MTQDLIKRLLAFASGPDIFWEAANTLEAQAVEIERLQKRSQLLLDDCNTWAQEVKTEQRLSFRAERDALRAEVEQLNAAYDELEKEKEGIAQQLWDRT